MPAYSQLKKPAAPGICAAGHSTKKLPLYFFSQQGGIVARTGRSTEGSFAKEERELRKAVEWSKDAFCTYSCFLRGLPTPKAPVWRLIRHTPAKAYEVSRHTTLAAAQKALTYYTTTLTDGKFSVEGPQGRPVV